MMNNTKDVKDFDIIIAGTGVAGLYAALNLDPALSVLLISKRELELSNSALAQGGIAAVLNTGVDSRDKHIRDTLVAGGFLNDQAAVEVLVDNGPREIMNLIKLGVDFDRDTLGNLHMTLEGGHSLNRIVHHKDTTGLEVVQKLLAHVAKCPNITILDNASILQLGKIDGGFCAGVLRGDTFQNFCGRYVILATGGIGRVYKYTTNSAIATGDGIFFADRLGAKVNGLSLIQFHPTAFAAREERERFLISESVRGEGAVLLNCRGERFMPGYDKRAELAPRDVVSHFIIEECKRTGSEDFYLDITAQDPEFIKARFPGIYGNCLREGIDITRDRIPVFPCQHYLMGGIDVDTLSRTTVDRLYAAGECSRTGVHGNNRLASNSLLEALVFSRRAARDISQRCLSGDRSPLGKALFTLQAGNELPAGLRSEVREIVQQSFFVNPDRDAARRGLVRVREIKQLLHTGGFADSVDYLEASSLTRIAELILEEVIR